MSSIIYMCSYAGSLPGYIIPVTCLSEHCVVHKVIFSAFSLRLIIAFVATPYLNRRLLQPCRCGEHF